MTRWAHDTLHNVYIITCQDSDCPAPVSGARCCSAWGWCTDNCPQRWSSRNLSSVFRKYSSSVSSRNKSGGQPVQNKSLTRLVVDRDKPRKFYDFGMTQGYQLDHLLSLRLFEPFFENLLLWHKILVTSPSPSKVQGTWLRLVGDLGLSLMAWTRDFGLGLGLVNIYSRHWHWKEGGMTQNRTNVRCEWKWTVESYPVYLQIFEVAGTL